MLRPLLIIWCLGSTMAVFWPYEISEKPKRDSPVQKRPCQQAASLILSLIEVNRKEQSDLNNGISNYDIDIFSFVLGLDVTPAAEFEDLVCHFFDDSTEEFLQYARQSGIGREALRRFYDWNALWLSLSAGQPTIAVPGTAFYELLTMMYQTGFLNLDPQGLEKATEFFAPYMAHLPPATPFELIESDTQFTCSDLRIGMIYYWRYLVPPEFNNDQLIDLVCNALLSHNISQLVQSFDNSGIVDIIVNAVRDYIDGQISGIPLLEANIHWSERQELASPVTLQQRRLLLNILYEFRNSVADARLDDPSA